MATSASSSPCHQARPAGPARLPHLFARDTQLLGWQGLSIMLPADWNLASFTGDAGNGNLRVDDGEGPRLELRWEKPRGSVDLERSVSQFLDGLAKQAKKKHHAFTISDKVRLLSKAHARKAQLVNFGWAGERAAPAGQGCGVAWECADCGRVVVAHFIGPGAWKPEKLHGLASELAGTLQCHFSGGWQTWSVFDLRLDIPEEFALIRSRLMTGRLELEWEKPAPRSLIPGLGRVQRIAVTRCAPANVLLAQRDLESWTLTQFLQKEKRWKYQSAPAVPIRDHPTVLLHGVPRDIVKRLRERVLDFCLHRPAQPVQLLLWHCAPSNKIFALETELADSNIHVIGDVIDSLECHL